jgi:Helix-turn-helix domain
VPATDRRSQYFTPATIAELLGLSKTDAVLVWIGRGDLKATNVATNPGGRPTWRIDPEDLNQFLVSRQAKPPEPVTRRRRAKRDEKVTQYF